MPNLVGVGLEAVAVDSSAAVIGSAVGRNPIRADIDSCGTSFVPTRSSFELVKAVMVPL
jgi:hypothetical protein